MRKRLQNQKKRIDVNIYDISREAGVSIATVSRVLNDSSRVSPATRDKVLKVMADCGYTPNAFARGLGLNTMKTIGLLCADFADAYLAKAISYLERTLRQNGYDCLLVCPGYEHETRVKMAEMLLSKRVDGMILVGSGFVSTSPDENAYILNVAGRVPVMILGAALDGDNVYSVFCDDRTATLDATAALIAEGRQRILYLYHAATYSGLKKLEGYRDALGAAGRPVDEKLIRLADEDANAALPDTRDFMEQLEREHLRYDAVMTSDDKLAVGALKYAVKHHIRVPEELSIIGFNNSVLSRCSEPELTSVDNKLKTLSVQCVSTLMGVLDGKDMPKRTVFSGDLVRRGTTLPKG